MHLHCFMQALQAGLCRAQESADVDSLVSDLVSETAEAALKAEMAALEGQLRQQQEGFAMNLGQMEDAFKAQLAASEAALVDAAEHEAVVDRLQQGLAVSA